MSHRHGLPEASTDDRRPGSGTPELSVAVPVDDGSTDGIAGLVTAREDPRTRLAGGSSRPAAERPRAAGDRAQTGGLARQVGGRSMGMGPARTGTSVSGTVYPSLTTVLRLCHVVRPLCEEPSFGL